MQANGYRIVGAPWRSVRMAAVPRSRLPQAIRRAIRRWIPPSALWRGGVGAEVAFWQDFFARGGGEWRADYLQRTDPSAPLGEPLIETRLEGVPSDPVRILDVGAGPTTSLGKVVPGRAVEIVGVDPLADRYREMLARLQVDVSAPSVLGHAERLDELFAPESFDVAYARNSLDHSRDPIAALTGMLRVLKPHGFVALRHFRREGEHAHYEEFHQWNFDIRDAGPEIWNRRERHVLAQTLPARVEDFGWDDPWITVVLRPA